MALRASPGAGTRRGLTADIGGGEHVVARDLIGAVDLLDGRDGAERNDAAVAVARFEQADVLGLQAELRVGLRGHAIGPAEEGEVVHIGGAEIGLKRAEDVAQGHVHALGFHAVHVQPELRNVGAEGREIVRQAGRLVGFPDHGKSLRLQFFEPGVAAVLDVDLVPARVPDAGDRRRREYRDKRLRNFRPHPRVHLGDDRRHLLLRRVAVVEILERQEDRGGVGLVAAEEVESGDFHCVENAGRLARDLGDLIDDGLRAIERSGIG